jgi:arylsulfatase A-like enzyme/Flp pilus assembly protein TadD
MIRILLCLAILLIPVGCQQQISKEQFPNIVLITLDTTRADALSAYGNQIVKMPIVDTLAKQGLVWESCYSQAPITLPSHSSIFTSLNPARHGVRNNNTYQLADTHVTLAEQFKTMGFQTGAFIGSIILLGRYGLNQGFDEYDDDIVHYEKREKNQIATRRADVVTDRAIAWIEQQEERPFFSWLHFYDPHWPYEPPSPFAEAYADAPYSGELAFVDLQIGRLIQHLKKQGVYDRTLIIITADHGEAFGAHGEETHGYFAYRSTTHVPLIFSRPFTFEPGTRFNHDVASIDIMPTLLELLGSQPSEDIDGVSLFSTAERQLYAEAMIPYENMYCSPVHALRNQTHSYYLSGEEELYDLRNDPDEKHNIIVQAPDALSELRRQMEVHKIDPTQQTQEAVQLDQETIELLRSLGYIHDGGTHIPTIENPYAQPSPKSSLSLYRVYQLLRHDEQTYPFLIIDAFKEMEADFPEHILRLKNLGRLLAFAGDREGAIRNMRKAAELRYQDPRLHVEMGLVYNHFGEYDQAVDEFRVALELDPNQLIARYNAAVTLLQKGEIELARENFLKVLEIQPEDSMSLNNLAHIAMEHQQDPTQAWDYILKAHESNPRHPLIRKNYDAIKQALRL